MEWAKMETTFQTISQTFTILLGVFILLILGWAVAYLVRLVIAWFLDRIKFDAFCEREGFFELLRKGKVTYTPAKLVAGFFFWMVIIVFLLVGSAFLGVQTSQTVLQRINANIPDFFGACFLLIVGILIANFLGNLVENLASGVNLYQGEILGRLIKFVVGIFVIVMVLEDLEIGGKTMVFSFQILFAGIVLALSLGFGLGCKDIIKESLERFMKKLRSQSRQESEGSDLEG